MHLTIAKITEVKDKTSKASGKPYKLTSFIDTEFNAYPDVYGEFKEGQTVEGDWANSEYGKRFEVQGNKRPAGATEKQFKADPDSRESIEWQVSLKAAVDVLRDYVTFSGWPKAGGDADLKWYVKEIDRTAIHFKTLMNEGKEQLK